MLLALIYAAYTDIKKQEIPIFLFPALMLLYTVIGYNDIIWKNAIFGSVIGCISFVFLALFFGGGGGDIIMMSCIGFIYGPEILAHIIIVASVLCILYYLIKKTNKAPYAPFVLLSYILCFLGGYSYGLNNYRVLEIRYFLL